VIFRTKGRSKGLKGKEEIVVRGKRKIRKQKKEDSNGKDEKSFLYALKMLRTRSG
jgi:hypothetical protein